MFKFFKRFREEEVKPQFMQAKDLDLSVEDKGEIHSLLTKNNILWEIIKKYAYNKSNMVMRQLMNCKPEETKMLQDKSKAYLEIIKDFEQIKKDFTKASAKKVDKAKDFAYYVSNSDLHRNFKGRSKQKKSA